MIIAILIVSHETSAVTCHLKTGEFPLYRNHLRSSFKALTIKQHNIKYKIAINYNKKLKITQTNQYFPLIYLKSSDIFAWSTIPDKKIKTSQWTFLGVILLEIFFQFYNILITLIKVGAKWQECCKCCLRILTQQENM